MKPEELSEITKAIEASAEKGIKKALLALGVDVHNPLEVQKDLAFARQQREASETIQRFAKRTVIGIFITSLSSVIWLGLKDFFN